MDESLKKQLKRDCVRMGWYGTIHMVLYHIHIVPARGARTGKYTYLSTMRSFFFFRWDTSGRMVP